MKYAKDIARSRQETIHRELTELHNQLTQRSEKASGADYHNIMLAVNTVDEMKNTIFAVSGKTRWNKLLDIAMRMAALIGDETLREQLQTKIKSYYL